MKALMIAALGTLAVVPATLIAIRPAEARPTYCVQQAWYYADRKAGKDRSSEAWDFYNSAFQDYNDCNTPYACDDFNRTCTPPPGI